ncbi:hypothetical protein ACFU51_23520 [Streptomyces sp. NPDC057430]|uniref:hypothetical protein n=1 Tax=unclassified Streptomyces TaxID=2593676 RepID=UPI00367A5BFE
MLTENTGRTAQDLAAELAGLRGVDWGSVWAGPPQGGSAEFREWCGRYGWEPQTVEGNLKVHTPSGGGMTFWSDGLWTPVSSLTHYASRLRASTAAENAELIESADSAWPAYLAAAESVLGPAAWSGPWNAPDFPEPPEPHFWRERESRLKTRNPYRLAVWQPVGDPPGQALFILTQSVAFPTWTNELPGSSTIALDVEAPEGSRRRR